MTSAEHSPLTRKLSAFVALSEVELAVLERLHERRRSFVAGRDMVHQGQSAQAAYILSSGWVCSYKLQPTGRGRSWISRCRGISWIAQRPVAHVGSQLRTHR